MFLVGDIDCNVDSAKTAVQEATIQLHGIVDAVREKTQFPSITTPRNQTRVVLNHPAPQALHLSILILQ